MRSDILQLHSRWRLYYSRVCVCKLYFLHFLLTRVATGSPCSFPVCRCQITFVTSICPVTFSAVSLYTQLFLSHTFFFFLRFIYRVNIRMKYSEELGLLTTLPNVIHLFFMFIQFTFFLAVCITPKVNNEFTMAQCSGVKKG